MSIQNETSNDHIELLWRTLCRKYKCPNWFRDAKFGIWAHWGVQTVPRLGGGWYARHMYIPPKYLGRESWGANDYDYHCKTYGHPSRFGYKDLCNLWKAENYCPDDLIEQWYKWGSRYVAILGNHHDCFDNWDSSKYYDWTSVNVGPKRDIVGEFAEAARKHKLPWVVTVHDRGDFLWFEPAFNSDREGPMKGVPYDGWLTKEDGRGKWWEGLDPRQLYGAPPSEMNESWIRNHCERWYARHLELITRYQPDALYFDSGAIPYGKYGEHLCAEYYRQSLERFGRVQNIIQVKQPAPGVMYDVERGVANEIREEPWQAEISLNAGWFLKEDNTGQSMLHHNERTVIETLCDTVSKNGNLLVNVGLRADGTLPKDQVAIMNSIGAWLKANGEAIYGAMPWKVFRDGSGLYTGNFGKSQVMDKNKEHFNERTLKSPPYCHDEVRFTCKKDRLFVHFLNPQPGKLKVPVLGRKSSVKPGKVCAVNLLAGGQKIDFKQNNDALHLEFPNCFKTGKAMVLQMLIDRE